MNGFVKAGSSYAPHLARRNAEYANDWALSESEYQDFALWANTDRDNFLRFATLLELNTG